MERNPAGWDLSKERRRGLKIAWKQGGLGGYIGARVSCGVQIGRLVFDYARRQGDKKAKILWSSKKKATGGEKCRFNEQLLGVKVLDVSPKKRVRELRFHW